MEKNYLVIKNEEIEVGEKTRILIIDFSKETDELISSFKIEQKEVSKRKNETNSKYQLKLDSLKESHKENLASLLEKKEEIKENYNVELETIEALKSSENTNLNKSLEDIEKDYLAQEENLLKEYESNIVKSNEEIEKINSLFEAEKAVLEDQLNDIQNVHDEKMAYLNSDINTKIKKMKQESNNNIKTSLDALDKAEEEYTKEFEDFRFEYDYSMGDLDKKHVLEKIDFDTAYAETESTLEAKVSRHEKYMAKSKENKDTRAVKQHKKEISILQKNAEKRLKDLTIEHENKVKEYDIKKKTALKENIEEIAKLNLKIAQIREDIGFDIKSFQAKIENDLECIEFRIQSNIQDEIHKFNEEEKNHAIKVSECILKHEKDLANELENQAKLKIAYDKEFEINKVKKDEAIETIQNEIKVLEATLTSRVKSAELQKEIDLAKVDYEIELAKIQHELDLKLNIENKNIELHDLDAIVHGEVHDKSIPLKEEINTLIETREDFILSFEEEVFNKNSLDVTFLENQKAKILADKANLITKISTVFEPEVIPEEGSTEETKVEETPAIEEVEIDLKEIEERKELALKELEEFFDIELSRIDNMITLLNDGKSEDIIDSKERNLKMFESSSILLLNAQLRNSKVTKDSNIFDGNEVKVENANIKEHRSVFEKEKEKLKLSYDKVISDFEKEIKSEEITKQKNISKEETELANKITTFNKQIKEIENTEIKNLKIQDSLSKEKHSKAENIQRNEGKRVNSEFAKKDSVHKSKASKIEKDSSSITKKLDVKNKLIKKEYETTISNKLQGINAKLQQDLKALQTK